MNILMLGNGFDLYHNLPTNYNDFLHTIETLIEMDNQSIETVGHVFCNRELQEKNKHIRDCYEQHKVTYDMVTLDKEKLIQIVKIAKTNPWYSYLINSFNKDVGWIDFEQEIADVVSCFKSFMNESGSTFVMGKMKQPKEEKYIIQSFDFFFNDTRQNAYPSGTRCEIKKEFITESPLGSGNTVANKEKIINSLFKELEKLEKCLKLYLEIFVDGCIEKIKDEENFLRCEAICSINKTITLNYTNVAEKVYSLDSSLHLHGNTQGNIILGINPDKADELNAMDTSFIAFKKYYQRICMGTDEEYIKWLKEIECCVGVEKINLLIMGHSLDVTDEDIIKDLFKVADEIIVLYHNQDAKNLYAKNLIRIFGKTEFDTIRKEKTFSFMSLNCDFTEFRERRRKEEYEKIIQQIAGESLNGFAEEITIV